MVSEGLAALIHETMASKEDIKEGRSEVVNLRTDQTPRSRPRRIRIQKEPPENGSFSMPAAIPAQIITPEHSSCHGPAGYSDRALGHP
jgi:hypothetical protein